MVATSSSFDMNLSQDLFAVKAYLHLLDLLSFPRRSMSFCLIWLILMGMVWVWTLIDLGGANKVFALKR